MAPEYAVDGLFSEKSDVFSFGILVLEIICGKRNRGLYQQTRVLNLVAHVRAWIYSFNVGMFSGNSTNSCLFV